jgi:formate hydrogenlyase subunit 6/NADH:ubiquinone oxidoreductase subunit I
MVAGAFIPGLLKNLTKTPATRGYPFVKSIVPKGFRGTPQMKSDLCVGCKACVRDCTSEAIEIILKPPSPTDAPPEEGKKPVKKFQMIIYLDRCIHCARCAEVCPKDAIYLDEEFEVANFTRASLKFISE